MPKISVIVPVYQVEPYLHRCVDSILAQTFTDLELVLVDDGSPDRCGEICDEYVAKDSRVHVIHQENGGLSAARNAGIDWTFANSESRWICFVDSDDWVADSFLMTLYHAVIENDLRISCCAYVRTASTKVEKPISVAARVLQWDVFYLDFPGIAVVSTNKLYEKTLFQNIRFPKGRIHEDEFITYKVLYEATRIAYCSENLYYYFQNSQSIIHQPFSLKRLDAIDALDEQCGFFKSINNTKLFTYRMHSRLVFGAMYLISIDKSEYASLPIWKKEKKKLRYSQKKLLIRYGKKAAPLSQNRWIYDVAFPVIGRIRELGEVLRKKMRGL